MNTYYTAERDAQILIQLMKEHGIRKIVASPGSTNICFVASVQQDPFFEIYSSVDERSAAYIACGLSAESGEPVAISCTGATASRNYMPGLTEAYYRHLPILAITSTQSRERIGNNIPQVLDRSSIPNDIAYMSVCLPTVYNEETEWSCILKANKALLELKRNGGGPVHIDLTTEYNKDFSVRELPKVRKIDRYTISDTLPSLNSNRIAVFVGAHNRWDDKLTAAVDDFCSKYNAVVLCDQTSNYWGKYRIVPNALCGQAQYRAECTHIDTLIHIGEISGCYMNIYPKKVWRVHIDGEVKDTFKALTNVFEMNELDFFAKYSAMKDSRSDDSYYNIWSEECTRIYDNIPELPFSNVWIAKALAKKIPVNSVLHFGILNSLRSWNYFEITQGVNGYSNVGGFGIDGGVSSLIGASFVDRSKIYFGIVGDLAFFYDMNAIGNRDITNNLRLIVINNGRGSEFRNCISWASMFGEDTDKYIAAAGHFGNKSPVLVRHLAEDLGFEYFSASSKEEFQKQYPILIDESISNKPILFEVFTTPEDESNAIKLITNVERSATSTAKNMVKSLLGESGTKTLKKWVKNR